ncbi:TnsA-like heteromeric transposase endonuclease subunit [Nonomuraea polychroma]|uniref:TnsA-like heteromeric transposase endonuclease subunit n=2 Tax=Nonomuraea TaxID=83681 RepID=UPI0019D449D9|nr:TnsA-like heteromeric transposase endonuclease subunit [Nonomuraea polychroma]
MLLSDADVVGSAEVRAKSPNGTAAVSCRFMDAPVQEMLAAGPWRTFRWHHGQKHYSGAFWSATEGSHVIYESRLELARLLFADFDRSVSRIVAQPFLMTAQVEGAERRHIPDFLLMTESGPLVVDVKPARRLARPEVAFTFAWSRRVIESRGWGFEVWSEPDPVETENIRFLAGYRRPWLFSPGLVAALEASVTDGVTLREAFATVSSFDPRLVRAAVLHLLWTGRFRADLSIRLCPGTVLRRSS